MDKSKTPFLEYHLYSDALSELPVNQNLTINTINQYSYCLAENDLDFKNALVGSDILLPDGVGVVAAVKYLTGQRVKKIAGADIYQYLLTQLNSSKGRCFFLGSSEETLTKITKKLKKDYPSVKAGFYSPPFKPSFTKAENQEMIAAINEFQPDVLFVGMTAPKQEKWVAEHKHLIDARITCAIGAVFDFYAGTVERPKKIWIDLGLEWFIRLLKEPKRMWRRYILYGPEFLKHIYKEKHKQSTTS